MKLRNKKTGKIKECVVIPVDSNGYPNEYQVFEKGESLAELNEEWEDYEEPKEYWCITGRGNLHYLQDMTDENDKDHREIGNYFKTKEEAEKAVEKLKAWKRLKDKGFRFNGLCESVHELPAIEYDIEVDVSRDSQEDKDLALLFGDKE